MMEVRFWGVRGSIASAGREHAHVGGNTSCVEVRIGGGAAAGSGAAAARGAGGADTLIVLDAGTGLRALGERLRGGGPVEAHILLSHFHWDHIQGFPFFAPAYAPENRLRLYGPERCTVGGDVRTALAAQMRAPHFPVGLEAMRAQLSFRAVAAGAEFGVGDARVRTAAGRHPNGVLAYRISAGGRSVVYATDTEHDPGGALDGELLELARGADVLIYDAQYTAAEYPARRGWGHSTPDEGARLAEAAGVGQLVLFHHDPGHDDWELAGIEAATRGLFAQTLAAREGLTLRLPEPATQKVA
jgi:phosphoribosyl 1,2-cyclic phosphodiesterase